MDESLKLYRLVPVAAADDPNWIDAKPLGKVPLTSWVAPSTSTLLFRRRPDRVGASRGYRIAVLVLVAVAIITPMPVFAEKAQTNSNCTVPNTNDGQGNAGKTARIPQASDDSKLADCGGVLKPPATGDTDLEKPAPQDGKTPVIPPSKAPGQQENKNTTPPAK
ncbi:MAG: hypothetical protein KGI75_25165 [Rhizobiaceae bacterium]|nr:hypothetical protein [Rhizobiaceae bacterium]